jgi:hypothetical protein
MLRCVCVDDFKKFDLNVKNRFHTASMLLRCCDWDESLLKFHRFFTQDEDLKHVKYDNMIKD